MTMATCIAQGAEARIFSDDVHILKERFQKKYRHPDLDSSLRKQRTRREAKLLEKLQMQGIPAPKLVKMDETDMTITMEKIDGTLLKDVFDRRYMELSPMLGVLLGQLHALDIIHGDFTTSNLILKKEVVHVIDFGLSFFSKKDEDRAVDLHVLKQALESKHYKVFEKALPLIIAAYKKQYTGAESVLARLEQVELRGRYKMKQVGMEG